ncbi:bacterial regulatory protein, lacI family domain-containing protein [Ditylenchus destructor]|nr:bacterial regulatory protein, lacI family domain-containing protein [Ditylenchus destructor]
MGEAPHAVESLLGCCVFRGDPRVPGCAPRETALSSDPMTTAPAPKRRRATGRVTLQDVALGAGVSPITASRALRGERSVAAELVERVTAAIAQLGYVPDPAARALASSRSNQVVVLIPLLSNALFVDLLDAAQRTLLAAGYQSLIGSPITAPRKRKRCCAPT